ncbi:hypothetical protein PoB_006369600 [Plakobranchus ocellatus]|uniref:Uncharacterized protein n=1 Tax=Plakobranchus ocellatus TaxID=259542 RepID=A0AAV4CZE5_9GAST|nr:hypothetical protein PoB_006369600 [Plakobranchus ocellatus]
MLAARFGSLQAISVMMEANQAGSVTIDLSAKDNNGQTAWDHATEGSSSTSPNRSEISGDSKSVSNSIEIQRLLAACGGADFSSATGADTIGARHRPLTPTSQDENKDGIEMVDMRGSSPRREIAGAKGKAIGNISVPFSTSPNQKTILKENLSDSDSTIDNARQWVENLKQEHEAAGRLSSLVSPAPCSRPGSRQGGAGAAAGIGGIPLRDRHPPSSKTSLGIGGGRTLRPGSATKVTFPNRPASRLRASSVETEDDDDDEDISLESLTELLGTVRQYAKEIHEIYAPIQRDEEERTRKKRERLARKKSREQEKSAVVAPLAPPPANQQQEVRVEIHAIEEQLKQRVQGNNLGRSRPQGPAHSRSFEPPWPGGAPVAMLTVEDEQLLSSTWPRGRLRPKSRERFWSDTAAGQGRSLGGIAAVHGAGQSSVSYPCSPSTSFTASDRAGGRPHIPQGHIPRLGGTRGRQADDANPNNIQQERDILNKAFQKIHKPNPMLNTFNKNVDVSTGAAGRKTERRLQEQVVSSRQSVIQVARQHQQNRQSMAQQLPSISIIAPVERGKDGSQIEGRATGSEGGVLPSAPPQDNGDPTTLGSCTPSGSLAKSAPSHDNAPPTFHVGDDSRHSGSTGQRHMITRQSKDDGSMIKSSNKRPGLRHRKSVDKGIGNGVMLEKY